MVIFAEEMKIIDKNAEELGVSTIQLMENAGSNVARIAIEKFPHAKVIAVCSGVGNNGGDGMVVARHLVGFSRKVILFLFGSEQKIKTKCTLINYEILKKMEFSIEIITIDDSSKIPIFKSKIKSVDLIIDALLGIGLNSEPFEPIKSAIKAVNESQKQVVSIDVPSGIFSDLYQKQKIMVESDLIITFHDIKPSLTIDELKAKTIICPIGIPSDAELFTGLGDLIYTIPKRKLDSHKGDNGTILVVGGSNKYSGAPMLVSLAALKTGADLAVNCVPDIIADTLRSYSPNLIVRSFKGNYFVKEHIQEIVTLFQKYNSMVLGPGIADNMETMDFVNQLLLELPNNKPIIIDADAFKAIKTNLEILKNKKVILTPHQGEFKLLFGETLTKNWLDNSNIVKEKAKQYSTTIILKGRYDIISDGLKTKINRTGHAGMTVGGTGDVLAGILGEITAINNNYFRAACGAAYLCGKAGEYAAKDFGNSLLATDVIEKIPAVLLKMNEQ